MRHVPSGFLWIPIETGWHVIHAGHIKGDHQPWNDWVHRNPNLQLVVATGRLRIQRDDEQLTLKRGELIILRPNQTHHRWGPVDVEGGFFFVQFRTSLTPIWRADPPLAHVNGPSIHVTHIAIPDIGQLSHVEPILQLFDQLVDIHLSQPLYHQVHANGLLALIMVRAARDCMDNNDPRFKETGFTPRQMEIIHEVIDFIDKNLHRPIQTKDICDHLNLSYKYVAKVVRAGLGMSLIEYVNRRRIHKARALLLQPENSVAQVARAVGFDDPYYFSRVFSNLEGVSPSVFRSRAYIPLR